MSINATSGDSGPTYPELVLDITGANPATLICLHHEGHRLVIKNGKAFVCAQEDLLDPIPIEPDGPGNLPVLTYRTQTTMSAAVLHGVFVAQEPAFFWVTVQDAKRADVHDLLDVMGFMRFVLRTRRGTVLFNHTIGDYGSVHDDPDEPKEGHIYASALFAPHKVDKLWTQKYLMDHLLLNHVRINRMTQFTLAKFGRLASSTSREWLSDGPRMPPLAWQSDAVRAVCASERTTEAGLRAYSAHSAPVRYNPDGTRERFKEEPAEVTVVEKEGGGTSASAATATEF